MLHFTPVTKSSEVISTFHAFICGPFELSLFLLNLKTETENTVAK